MKNTLKKLLNEKYTDIKIFKKIYKKNYFKIFLSKKYFKKQLQSHSQTSSTIKALNSAVCHTLINIQHPNKYITFEIKKVII